MIDPSIALGYRPPQINIDVPSPIHQMGQVLTLRGLMEQSQARQLEMQQTRMQIDAAQRAQQDDQILRKSYADAGGDLDKTAAFLMQRGGSPKALQDLQQHQLNLRKTTSEIDKNELPTLQFRNEQTIELIRQAQGLPADQYAQRWPALVQQYQQINPKEQLPATMIPQDQLGTLLLGHQTAKQAMDYEQAQRDAKKTAAEIEAKNAETLKTNLAAQQLRRQNAIPAAMTAFRNGPEEYQAFVQGLPAEDQPAFANVKSVDDIWKTFLAPEQRQQAEQFAITSAEAKRHNLSTESTARLNAAVNAGRLNQEQIVNGIKYGPGTTQFWVQQLYDNPDSVKELPPEMKSVVGQAFSQKYNLPLPTALGDTAKTTETSARNALDQIGFIRNALQNPEIRSRIGPIMGRLGEKEQDVGATVGLSPEAATLAQELRTRMRYFVFQEGKAMLGGRMPQNLMNQLESSSANVKMEPDTLEGALRGAEGSAQNLMQNLDRQRFGGKARTAPQAAAPAATGATKAPPPVGTISKGHRYIGGDPSKKESWVAVGQ